MTNNDHTNPSEPPGHPTRNPVRKPSDALAPAHPGTHAPTHLTAPTHQHPTKPTRQHSSELGGQDPSEPAHQHPGDPTRQHPGESAHQHLTRQHPSDPAHQHSGEGVRERGGVRGGECFGESVREDVRGLVDRAVFEERDRIARDLHDLVVQRLFALGLGIQSLHRHLASPAAQEQLKCLVADIDQSIRDVRRGIFFLQQRANPLPSLRCEVLRVICEAAASLGYEPTVRLEGPLDSAVPPEVHLDLIATLREALSNVIRHADARSVWVAVRVDPAVNRLELLVRDDGRGLPGGPVRRSGLTSVSQRAYRLRGHCHFHTPKTGGTRVFWAVPLASTTTSIQTGAEQLEATS